MDQPVPGGLPPKQLSMSITAQKFRRLEDVAVPEGYVLRGYRPGDEDGWVSLLNEGAFETSWDRDRLDEYLSDQERREGSRVIVHDDEIAAATFASRREGPVRVGVLDYVVSHPDHRNNGLGRAVCAAVLRFFAERGYETVTLTTDDWRLPAIKVYLSLGFEPQMTREDMHGRWRTVLERLGLFDGNPTV